MNIHYTIRTVGDKRVVYRSTIAVVNNAASVKEQAVLALPIADSDAYELADELYFDLIELEGQHSPVADEVLEAMIEYDYEENQANA